MPIFIQDGREGSLENPGRNAANIVAAAAGSRLPEKGRPRERLRGARDVWLGTDRVVGSHDLGPRANWRQEHSARR